MLTTGDIVIGGNYWCVSGDRPVTVAGVVIDIDASAGVISARIEASDGSDVALDDLAVDEAQAVATAALRTLAASLAAISIPDPLERHVTGADLFGQLIGAAGTFLLTAALNRHEAMRG